MVAVIDTLYFMSALLSEFTSDESSESRVRIFSIAQTENPK